MMKDNTIWEFLSTTRENTTPGQFGNAEERVAYSSHEIRVLEMIGKNQSNGNPQSSQYESKVGDDDQATMVSADDSIASQQSIGNDSVSTKSSYDAMAENMDDMMMILGTDLEQSIGAKTPKSQEEKRDPETELKKIGNVTKYPFEREALRDRDVVGREKLKDIISERQEQRAKEERKLQLIYDSVKFYKRNMQVNLDEIRETLEKNDGDVESVKPA